VAKMIDEVVIKIKVKWSLWSIIKFRLLKALFKGKNK